MILQKTLTPPRPTHGVPSHAVLGAPLTHCKKMTYTVVVRRERVFPFIDGYGQKTSVHTPCPDPHLHHLPRRPGTLPVPARPSAQRPRPRCARTSPAPLRDHDFSPRRVVQPPAPLADRRRRRGTRRLHAVSEVEARPRGQPPDGLAGSRLRPALRDDRRH